MQISFPDVILVFTDIVILHSASLSNSLHFDCFRGVIVVLAAALSFTSSPCLSFHFLSSALSASLIHS